MTALVVSTWELPASRPLAAAARLLGWNALALEEASPGAEKIVFYGGTDVAMSAAARLRLSLLEPTFDTLAKLPMEFRCRNIELACFGDLVRLKSPTFVKPADALNKSFDAGIYQSVRNIRTQQKVTKESPVLLSEPVEWSAEFRCFIRERQIAAWSPYISFGRPNWKPFGLGTLTPNTPAHLVAFSTRLFDRCGDLFPPSFVMDIGLIDERGWAVVELNPVWCSGVLGADPHKVLAVLERACQSERNLSIADKRWVMDRQPS